MAPCRRITRIFRLFGAHGLISVNALIGLRCLERVIARRTVVISEKRIQHRLGYANVAEFFICGLVITCLLVCRLVVGE